MGDLLRWFRGSESVGYTQVILETQLHQMLPVFHSLFNMCLSKIKYMWAYMPLLPWQPCM